MADYIDPWNPNHGAKWLRDWWEKIKHEGEMNELQKRRFNQLIAPHVILSVWQIGRTYCYNVHPLGSHVTIIYRLYVNGDVDEIIGEHFILPKKKTIEYSGLLSLPNMVIQPLPDGGYTGTYTP